MEEGAGATRPTNAEMSELLPVAAGGEQPVAAEPSGENPPENLPEPESLTAGMWRLPRPPRNPSGKINSLSH